MAKATNTIDSTAAVTAFIQKLEPSFAELIEGIRKAILSTGKEVSEHIKWNSPAFYYNGEMADFDPKEYKRDIAVIHVRKAHALIVLPTGMRIKDATGILEGNYTDGRRMITIKDMADLKAKEKALKTVIKAWLDTVEK